MSKIHCKGNNQFCVIVKHRKLNEPINIYLSIFPQNIYKICASLSCLK